MTANSGLARIVGCGVLALVCGCTLDDGNTSGAAAGAASTAGAAGQSGADALGGMSAGAVSGSGGASVAAGTGGMDAASGTGGASGSAVGGASGLAGMSGMGGASDSGAGGASGTAAGASGSGGSPAPRELTLLVTNDDGVSADGIDVLVEALRKLPMVSVVVVAPAMNQSITGPTTTDGPVEHEPSMTKSGYPAVAVHGYPADTINVALDDLGIEPDFVFSGSNEGANAGIAIELSGTVGAARQAAKRGIPALAVSQELVLGLPTDFATSVGVAIDWFKEHRGAIEAGTLSSTSIVNVNAPTCAAGAMMRGTVEVPASSTLGLLPSDCTSTATDAADDVTALWRGYASLTPALPLQ